MKMKTTITTMTMTEIVAMAVATHCRRRSKGTRACPLGWGKVRGKGWCKGWVKDKDKGWGKERVRVIMRVIIQGSK